MGAPLAAETPRRETCAKTVAAVVIHPLALLAPSYADLARERLRSGARLTARGLLGTILPELLILIGAAILLATLLTCWSPEPACPPPSSRRCGPRPGSPGHRARRRTTRPPQGPAALSQAFVGAFLGSLIILLRGCSLSPERRRWGRHDFA